MTIEERKAIQAVLIDELAQRQAEQPTLLIDALLSGQGQRFVRQILTARAGVAQNMANMTAHLLWALNSQGKGQPPAEPSIPQDPDAEEVA